jgi:Fe-S oxidoreductase
LRPLKDHLVGQVEQTAPLLAKAPTLVNTLIGSKPVSWLLEKTVGYVDTPLLSVPVLTERISAYRQFDLPALQALPLAERQNLVLFVQDPFTSFYEAELVADAMALCQKLGFDPVLLPFLPNGKPQHVKGFLREFAQTAQNASQFLQQVSALGAPLLGLDASLVLVYRDEYQKILGPARGDYQVHLLHEWLSKQSLPRLTSSGQYRLLAHCTEKTALPATEKSWQSIYQAAGLQLDVVATGCCGMAGTYGHEAQNQQNSRTLYDLSWAKPVQQSAPDLLLVTGYSCRSQVKRYEGFKPKHPLQALLHLMQ